MYHDILDLLDLSLHLFDPVCFGVCREVLLNTSMSIQKGVPVQIMRRMEKGVNKEKHRMDDCQFVCTFGKAAFFGEDTWLSPCARVAYLASVSRVKKNPKTKQTKGKGEKCCHRNTRKKKKSFVAQYFLFGKTHPFLSATYHLLGNSL